MTTQERIINYISECNEKTTYNYSRLDTTRLIYDCLLYTSITDVKKEKQVRQIIKHDTVLVCHVADTQEFDKEMPLKCPADLQNFLDHHHIPFASEWTSLSIQESGWNWESYNAQVNHNMFGLSYCYFKNKYDRCV